MTIEEAWAALDKPLFDLEWTAASGEDTAEIRGIVEAAVLALCHAVLEELDGGLYPESTMQAVAERFAEVKVRIDALGKEQAHD